MRQARAAWRLYGASCAVQGTQDLAHCGAALELLLYARVGGGQLRHGALVSGCITTTVQDNLGATQI
jgi:hypothetical protein